MALVAYSFYENENGYAGTTVSDDLFSKYQIKAMRYLDRLTFGRIISVTQDGRELWGMKRPGRASMDDFMEFTKEELESVKYAVCALIDAMYNTDKAEGRSLAGNADAGNVKSRSSGGESISYEVGKSVYDAAVSDRKVRDMLYMSTVREWMNPARFRLNPFYAGSR